MKTILYFIGCLLSASFFVSCNNEAEVDGQKETNGETTEEWEPDMYEASELVLVMRQMYDDNMALKTRIQEGHVPESMPEEYNKILTASATNPDELDQLYYAMAQVYLNDWEALTLADESDVLEKYNNMVKTCVNCHQNYCMGPIPKIEKLYIK